MAAIQPVGVPLTNAPVDRAGHASGDGVAPQPSAAEPRLPIFPVQTSDLVAPVPPTSYGAAAAAVAMTPAIVAAVVSPAVTSWNILSN